MALIPSQHPQIQVTLTDRIFNDTVIKQEATFVALRHEQHPETGIGTAIITVLVKSYGNDNGAKGIALSYKGVPDRRIDLVADNNTVVDATTGDILAINPVPYSTPEWLATLDAITVDYIYQGDFFLMLRESAPIIIGDLIREHITNADHMGKFA